tara:strand:- start:124 stop:459 length:336 start_codon:yes stop_codon:yes gene_type:complete
MHGRIVHCDGTSLKRASAAMVRHGVARWTVSWLCLLQQLQGEVGYCNAHSVDYERASRLVGTGGRAAVPDGCKKEPSPHIGKQCYIAASQDCGLDGQRANASINERGVYLK